MCVRVLPPSFLRDLLRFLSTMFWDASVSAFSAFCSSVFSIYLNQFKNVSPCYWRYTSERTLTFSYHEHPAMNIFAEASGVRRLDCLCSDIWGSGLGEDFSGRSFQKVYKMYTPMCLIFPLHQACEIYGSRGKSSLLLSLSLFWQIKLDWNTVTNWLQTVCNCFCETMTELGPYKRPPGLHSLKYLLYTLYRKSLPTTVLYPCK